MTISLTDDGEIIVVTKRRRLSSYSMLAAINAAEAAGVITAAEAETKRRSGDHVASASRAIRASDHNVGASLGDAVRETAALVRRGGMGTGAGS